MISTLRQYLAERKFTRVNESFFAEKNIDRALELYGKILSKKFGDKFLNYLARALLEETELKVVV